ncbi:PucR family transcriptional regulator [Nocardioides sp. ChNu-153]|uniref:PucR family transcriptional regulator n=1 Tax=unclassified Nocardioides TaxID=2615069 RepID=UPI0024052A21|nr:MULTISPECIES: PucR family transcriptional regulator [unclassified Nocardioides]MDF9714669.1 PucR family transcriptional regulator ligand-binding domain-containing protein [Nocardioides sp. ChNu-99]MDN7119796.1 PucR family transcriptional regulator [Nocardioides sp. ChNu-153]
MVPLADVLALPAFRAARPTVLAGEVAGAEVRWVHSSEVYEMGALLEGGEVLLTTGLGLHGRTDAQLATYVDQLADAGCVALGLELGRSFLDVPEPLVRRARERGLVLLAFGAVVPFERHVEDFHELVLRRRSDPDGGGDAIPRRFVDLVLSAAGLRALLDEVARAAGCQAEVHDMGGRLVERSRIRTVRSPDDRTTAPVLGRRGARATLVLLAPATPLTRRVAAQAAVAVALELARHPDPGQHSSAEQAMISDLHAGVLVSAGDVASRLAHAGLRVAAGDLVATTALDAGPDVAPTDLLAALREHAPPAPAVAGVVGTHVVSVTRLPPSWDARTTRRHLADVADAVGRHLGCPSAVLLAVTSPTGDLTTLAPRLEEARDLLRLARRHGSPGGAVLARDLGVQRLLASVTSADEVAAFVAEQLGPLVDADRSHGSALLRTLDAYLRHALSKAATAQALGIRRQSLYARLERVERLLGVSLDDPEHRAGLTLALTAWRLRTGLDPQASF